MNQAMQTINTSTDYSLPKKGISRVEDEILIAERDKLKATIKKANETLAIIDPELYKRAERKTGKKYRVGDRTVMIVPRPNFNTVSLAFARKKDAIKEVPDSEILKPLWDKTKELELEERIKKIPGLAVTEYVTVK